MERTVYLHAFSRLERIDGATNNRTALAELVSREDLRALETSANTNTAGSDLPYRPTSGYKRTSWYLDFVHRFTLSLLFWNPPA